MVQFTSKALNHGFSSTCVDDFSFKGSCRGHVLHRFARVFISTGFDINQTLDLGLDPVDHHPFSIVYTILSCAFFCICLISLAVLCLPFSVFDALFLDSEVAELTVVLLLYCSHSKMNHIDPPHKVKQCSWTVRSSGS